MKPVLFLISLFFFLTGIPPQLAAQSKAIYTNPYFNQIAQNHKKLAIVPFAVKLELRPNQLKQITPEELVNMELAEGHGVQNALYAYFLRKKAQKDFRVDFQDINKTNALLKKSNMDPHDLSLYTPEELCAILGVDGIISGHLFTQKPMSEGAAVVIAAVFNDWAWAGPTNAGNISISLNDAKEGELLWKYDKTLSRSLGSDINTIIDAMMRKASRKFPYKKLDT
jgi:hypothetical protein